VQQNERKLHRMAKTKKSRLKALCFLALATATLGSPATVTSSGQNWDAAFYQNSDAYLTQNRNVTLAPSYNDASPAKSAVETASGNAVSLFDMLSGGADGIAILGTIILYFIGASALRNRNRNLRAA
jgi:hypothetical protein